MEHLGGPDKTRTVLKDSARRASRGSRPRPVALGGIRRRRRRGPAAARKAGFDSTTCYYITASGKAALPDRPLDDYADLMACHEAFWKEMDTRRPAARRADGDGRLGRVAALGCRTHHGRRRVTGVIPTVRWLSTTRHSVSGCWCKGHPTRRIRQIARPQL